MNKARALDSFRIPLLVLLGLGAATSGTARCAEAQQLPQIGLSAAFAQLHQETGSYPHSPGAEDRFGFAIAAGDFDADGFDDLAMGVPGNDCDFAVWDCGSVWVRFGGATGALSTSVTLDPATAGAPEPAHEFDEYGRALAVGDFDNDGHDDLAVGMPGNYDISANGGTGRLGGVQVHYGLDRPLGGIQGVGEHFLRQGQAGVPSLPFDGEKFGAALAVGDFDGDGHDDLAIGATRNSFNNGASGNVTVAHGGSSGLLPFVGFEMRLGMAGLPDVPEAGEDFGWALAAGDFDGDGFDDLAIGVPSEDDVGAVLVVYGSQFSLLFADHWYFGQWDLNATTQPGERFGEALAAGDFDDDGFDDLAIGIPRYDATAALEDIGLAAVVHGSAAGLGPARLDWLWEDQQFGAGHSEPFDNFGNALAAGDFDSDGIDDLAVGIAGEDAAFLNLGAVSVTLGRRSQGLVGGTVRRLFPRGEHGEPGYDPAGMIPDIQGGDPFWGFALATGDFDGNGFDDLAIGGPARDLFASPTLLSTGAVAVVFGQLFIDGFETSGFNEWSSVAP